MILLTAVLAGTLVGWAIARWEGETWRLPSFRTTWLVVLGFLPQYFAFYFSPTRQHFPNWLASSSLIFSQLLLLVFVILNCRISGMIILFLGLGCNLIVIVANGGFMPLSVETASHFVSGDLLNSLEVGARISHASKDILLPESNVIFPWLADRFVPPSFFPYRFAFSLGDIFVAFGAFWLLIKGRSSVPSPS